MWMETVKPSETECGGMTEYEVRKAQRDEILHTMVGIFHFIVREAI